MVLGMAPTILFAAIISMFNKNEATNVKINPTMPNNPLQKIGNPKKEW